MNFARLTEKHADGNGYYMRCSGACRWDDVGSCAGCSELERIVDRLGMYEDSGLAPEGVAFLVSPEMQEVAQMMKECLEAWNDELQKPDPQIFGVSAIRLQELAQAEKEGRLNIVETEENA